MMRCEWAGDDPLMVSYHDEEWGVPVHDDRQLFEFLVLEGAPSVNRYRSMSELPSETKESRVMSRELAARGFRFVGPTICYAFMQAVGMVNDHLVPCFRHPAGEARIRR